MAKYATTRKFSGDLVLEEILPPYCRTVTVTRHADGTQTATASISEMPIVRLAIRSAAVLAPRKRGRCWA